MKRRGRLAALMLAALCCLAPLCGCAGSGDALSLSVCVGGEIASLDPIYARESGDRTILVHLYENLMCLTADGTAANGAARSVTQEVNLDGTVTYTFRLRSAKWSDGRTLRAADFVYAWRRLADPANRSPYAQLLSVVSGYEEARSSGDMSLLQISARNESTLLVTLSGRYDWFLPQVCTAPATLPLREDVVKKLSGEEGAQAAFWWKDPMALVTNGPYRPADYEGGASLRVTAYDRYSGTRPEPREITFRFASTAEAAQALYDAREADIVWPLTQERFSELLADKGATLAPELGTWSVLFNGAVFSDPVIRQAMTLAVDRTALAEAAGPGASPAAGLVPPGVPENEDGDFRALGGTLDHDPADYADRCAQARQLLEEAGYDGGAMAERELLYCEQEMNGETAQLLCDQWREALGVQVTPRAVSREELAISLSAGRYALAATCLTALCSDAECFLMRWTSGRADNVVGYANSAYDTLMSIIAGASGTARMGCLHDAEELLLADCRVVPLYSRLTGWEVRRTLTGAVRDPRGYFNLTGVINRPA